MVISNLLGPPTLGGPNLDLQKRIEKPYWKRSRAFASGQLRWTSAAAITASWRPRWRVCPARSVRDGISPFLTSRPPPCAALTAPGSAASPPPRRQSCPRSPCCWLGPASCCRVEWRMSCDQQQLQIANENKNSLFSKAPPVAQQRA